MTTLRQVSVAVLAELDVTCRRPGYLIEIGWPSGTTRSATFADVAALGFDWQKTAVQVTRMGQDSAGKSTCELVFENAELEWSTLALGDTVTDVPVRIHMVYAGATADADIMQDFFAGILNGVEIPKNGRQLILKLMRRGEIRFVPQYVLGPAIGVNHLIPPGKVITLNGQTFTAVSGR